MPEMNNWFVVVMGLGTVFVGLICIIIICKIMGLFFKNRSPKTESVSNSKPVNNSPIENKQEIIAAVSAVLAEELGTDINALRIHSFKKI